MSSITQTLQNQQVLEQLIERFHEWFLTALLEPTPPGLGRFQYPKCPFCKRRPEIVEVKGQGFNLPLRRGSQVTIWIPKLQILPCCSAQYAMGKDKKPIKNEGLSQLQLRRLHDAVKKEQQKVKR
jgi:hypothetical protein